MQKSRLLLIAGATFILSFPFASGNSLNIATAGKYPYSDPQKGRTGYSLADEIVNEARVYDFYQRQADYYMANPDKIPAVIPAFPGLDGGLHGHWGKHNQNGHNDGRWNDGDTGEHFAHVIKGPKGFNVEKGVCVKLGDGHLLSTCFDPQTLSYRAVWSEGWLTFGPFRWGSSRGATIQGKPWFQIDQAKMPNGGEYLGLHRFGKRVVFEYRIGSARIQDEPWSSTNSFFRRIDFLNPSAKVSLPCQIIDKDIKVSFSKNQGIQNILWKDGEIIAEGIQKNASVVIRISRDDEDKEIASVIAHLKNDRKIKKRWNEVLKVPGTLGKPKNGSAYTVDTLTVPYDNPYNTVMQLTSMAFLPNGDALIASLPGDIWLVKGINQDLSKVTWQRYATGFNQPVGIHIDNEGVFVLDRCQISILHDSNNDEEVDYYEKYANDFGGFNRSHTHTFGLHRTGDGAFYFIQLTSLFRTGTDRKTEVLAYGVRNCMGVGGSKNYFWAAPQEGTWTPASAIIEVNQGEHYGNSGEKDKIASPLCYVPRGVDNSTGGMVEITSDKWGPFKGSHIGLSYGANAHYLILRDGTSKRPQGAVVPLEGEFLAGVMRGAFHPKDGQLYTVGLDGWGDYSTQDGCFHRVRYVGGKVRKPIGFKAHENGLRIDFAVKLDAKTGKDAGDFFAQQWNYEYGKRYGSPEFSVNNPDSLGHDPVPVRSVKLLDNKESIFVEMPALKPVMQLYLRMKLRDVDGVEFSADLFSSPMYPHPPYSADGLAKVVATKRDIGELRTENTKPKKKPDWSGKITEGAREILIKTISGLKYDKTLVEAKKGETLVLKLVNVDAMPHNLVIVKPGTAQKVGDASFKMLNDPKAGEKDYVPDLSEVVHFVPVIDPNTQHSLHFTAPKEAGDYPFICTFPGHWIAMQGILRIK
jgi:uncharacterized cupredoxin-like copper-binding protein